MPLGQLRSLKRLSDLSIPSRAYSDLTGVKNQFANSDSKFDIRGHYAALLRRDPSAPRASHCHTLLCTQSLLVASKYSTFRLAILRLSCYEFVETADVSVVISVIMRL
jgi:hypothetical protein